MQYFKKFTTQVFVTFSIFASATHLHAATQLAMGFHDGHRPLLVASHDDGKAWYMPDSINPLSDDATLNFGHCSDGHCLVGGFDYNPRSNHVVLPLFITSHDNGHSWSRAKSIPSFPPQVDGVSAYHVSCVDKTCTAVGTYQRIGDTQHPLLMVSQDRGDNWSFVEDITGFRKAYAGYLQTISCTKQSCVAGGSYDYGLQNPYGPSLPLLVISKDQGRSWTFVKNISGLPSPINTSSTIYSIECSNQMCVASGSIRDKELNVPMLLVSKDSGASWTFVSNYGGLPADTNDVALFGLSCAGNLCAAAGAQFDFENQNSRLFLLTTHDSGQSWSFVKNISGLPTELQNAMFNKISCHNKTCVAIGSGFVKDGLPPIGEEPLLVVSKDSGQTWSNVKNISGLPETFTPQMLHFSDVKCSANVCTIVGRLSKDVETIPVILQSWDNAQTWTMMRDIIGLPKNSLLTNLTVSQ